MLVLSRTIDEVIVVGDKDDPNIGFEIDIVIVSVHANDRVRLGIIAPKNIPVHRREVFDIIKSKCESAVIKHNNAIPPAPHETETA